MVVAYLELIIPHHTDSIIRNFPVPLLDLEENGTSIYQIKMLHTIMLCSKRKPNSVLSIMQSQENSSTIGIVTNYFVILSASLWHFSLL